MTKIIKELADLVVERRNIRRLITQLSRRQKKLDEEIFRVRYEYKMADPEYFEMVDAIFAEDAEREKAIWEQTKKPKATKTKFDKFVEKMNRQEEQ